MCRKLYKNVEKEVMINVYTIRVCVCVCDSYINQCFNPSPVPTPNPRPTLRMIDVTIKRWGGEGCN